MSVEPSLSQTLILSTLEVLSNQAIALRPNAEEALSQLAGTVIRVKTYSPSYVCYLLITEDGIEVLPWYDGHIDIRIRGTLGNLLYFTLTDQDPIVLEHSTIRIHGDIERVQMIKRLMQEFDLWQTFKEAITESVQLPQLLNTIKQTDPSWAHKLERLPEVVESTLKEVQRQGEQQLQLLQEIKELKQTLNCQRRADTLSLTTGISFLMLSIVVLSGLLPAINTPYISTAEQALLIAATGFTILLSRIFIKSS